MSSLDLLLSSSRYAYKAGTGDATITLTAGMQLKTLSVRAPAGTDCTFTIAPGGANQVSPATAGEPITVLTGTSFAEDFLGQLGVGTVIAITGSGSYFVSYFMPRTGAAR